MDTTALAEMDAADGRSGMTPSPSEPRVISVFDETFLNGAAGVTEVLLVRHGQQAYDRNGPVRDMIDAPLSDLGRAQARLVGRRLADLEIDAVYASPLRRALVTGDEIARHHGLRPTVVDGLREIGIFRDVPPTETAAEFLGPRVLAAARERMLEERSWDAFPCSEPSAEFRARVLEAVESIVAAHRSGRIVVACHGGVINAYAGHLIRSPYDMFFQPAHTSISVVAAGHGRRAIRSLNDVRHLDTAEGSFATV